MTAQEVSDTTRLNPSCIRFETETVITKTGKSVEKVYAVYSDEYYESNKVSLQRYKVIKRFGGIPTVVLITTGKTKKRIVVL